MIDEPLIRKNVQEAGRLICGTIQAIVWRG
jgi:hypothetical protein